jgi:hypothetical protein
MPESTPFRTLTRHFTRMLFATGEDASQTGTVRMLAGVSAPMLMAAFWIVTLAHNLRSWDAASIHYLFVLYSFCAMGCVTTLQWERLFPTRSDFLILLPLPVRPRTLFSAKLISVAGFLFLFQIAANLFGTLLFPMLYGTGMPRIMLAHAIAVFGAGIAASFAVLAMEALVIVIVPESWFHRVAPIVQTVLIAALLTLFLHVFTVGEQLHALLTGALPAAQYLPPLWFSAVYETRLGGTTATPLAATMAHRAWECLPFLFAAVAILYPTAWKRRQHMALESARGARIRKHKVAQSILHGFLLQHPDQWAVFHFTVQTLARLSRYHVLLAAYCSSGIALALTAALSLHSSREGLTWTLNPIGIHMALPILLFWTIAGLRVAFLLPEELRARWIFQMAPLQTARVVSTMKKFVFLICVSITIVVLALLAACGWDIADLCRQACFGLAAAVLLADLFFFLTDSIPFTRPNLPDRSSLPLTLAVYIFGVPMFLLLMITLEHWVGTSLPRLTSSLLVMAGIHGMFHFLRRLPSHAASEDPFLGESDGDVQILGLSH